MTVVQNELHMNVAGVGRDRSTRVKAHAEDQRRDGNAANALSCERRSRY